MENNYANKPSLKAWHLLLLMAGIIFAGSFSSFAQSYDLPIQGNNAVRCGAGELTLEVEWSGAPLDPDKVKWYIEPFYGTPIATGLTHNTGYIEYTHTFFVDYTDDNGCSQCDRLMVQAVINENVVEPQISYSSLTICNNVDQEFQPTIVGASSGTFSVSPASGLSVNGSNGIFNPNGADAGSYTITFEPVDVIGCNSNPVTTTISITQEPEQPAISFPENEYCTTSAPVSVNRTAGPAGGTYSAAPTGLSINSVTGEINTATSEPGNYTVTYVVPGSGGCGPVSATTNVTINQLPLITAFSYNQPFCGSLSTQSPTLEVTGEYIAAATPYSYTGAGSLDLNTQTGEITPSGSDAGTYTVKYTIPAGSVCAEVTENTTVEIYPVSTATISTDKTSVFAYETEPVITFSGSVGPAPYTYTYRLDVGSATGTPVETADATITQSTEVAGTYTYTLLSVKDANGCTEPVTGQSLIIEVKEIPETDFAYTGTPYCQNGGTATPTLSGSTTGTFSKTAGTGNLDLNTSTGVITLANSDDGTYTITRTIDGYSATAEVIVTRLPEATFSYASTDYCPTAGEVSPSVINDIGIFTANDPVVVFSEGDGIAPGTINTEFTPQGTYTITNTIQAANGCAEVSASTDITINASPNYTATRTYTICSNETTSITHDANIEGSSFYWTVGTITGDITGASDGSGGSITQTLVNPSNTIVGSVEYIVTPSDASGCGDGIPTSVIVTVNPLPKTPTAVDNTLTYDGTEKVADASSTVIANTEAAVINWYTSETETTTTTSPAGTDVGTYTAWAEAEFESTGCISESRTLVTLTINPRPLTAASTINDKTYDGSTATGTVNLEEVNNVVYGEDLNITPSATNYADANAGTGKSTTISYALSDGTNGKASNYSMANLVTTGNILQAELTVSTDDKTKVYGETNPALTFQYSGFVNSETAAVLTTEPTATTTVDATTEAGTYTDAITVSGGDDNNYSFTYNAADFTVTKATLTVTAEDIVRGVGETSPAYSYSMSGFKNSETESALRAVNKLSGSVTFTDDTEGSTTAGTYSITPVITDLTATNYDFTATNGSLIIANIVVTSSSGTARAGYASIGEAYTAINNGIHTGTITIHVYVDINEGSTATLNTSGTGSASYTSVTIIAENSVNISGTGSPLMILGQSAPL
ncbi:MBG domain-containing protein [Draconibacterium orientale]|uniref:MBG domain-containing protein n=1 Tax=Draconibacterium orientale TaxID=1168034 RepID=UPI002ABD6B92|nr:MBG domain-containing protein [Draconibacterium orientale]